MISLFIIMDLLTFNQDCLIIAYFFLKKVQNYVGILFAKMDEEREEVRVEEEDDEEEDDDEM